MAQEVEASEKTADFDPAFKGRGWRKVERLAFKPVAPLVIGSLILVPAFSRLALTLQLGFPRQVGRASRRGSGRYLEMVENRELLVHLGHQIVPAEAGIVEIRSMAPASIERQCVLTDLSWYGYGDA